MNQLTKRPPPGQIMQMSSVFNGVPAEADDMTHGVALSFPLLGIKGGKFHYRWKGEDTIIADARGFAVPAIHVVILKAQKDLTRTFYDGGYVEGENRRPDCWSSDGIKPDDLVAQPWSNLCQTCPNAAWGSGATPAAPRAQACQQRRRTIVVPYWGDGGDLTNEAGGGPMLLSVPPGSLTNQLEYGKWLDESGMLYFACVTQLNFDQDPSIAFPKLEFSFVQPLTDEEGTVVLGLRESEGVTRILTSKINVDGPEVADAAQPENEPVQQPQPAASTAAVRPVNRPAPNQQSSVRAPQAQPAQAQPAQAQPRAQAPLAQAPQAPQQPQRTAQATAPGAPVNPASGAAVRPTPGARPIQPAAAKAPGQPGQPAQGGTINAAVNRPAQAPQTQRPVRTAQAQPTVQQPQAPLDDEAQPTGEVGARMTQAFDNLMGS